MDAFDVQVETDNLRLDFLNLPEGMEIIVVAGGPAVAGMAVGQQATVNYTISNRLLGFDLQNPQLQRAVTGIF